MKKKILVSIFILMICNSSSLFVSSKSTVKSLDEETYVDDYDPLVDLNITFEIQALRAIDKIDLLSEADFFLKIKINEELFTSPTWTDQNYLYNCWNVTKDVPDNEALVNISIELWDYNTIGNQLCDLSAKTNKLNSGYTIDLVYDIRTGLWDGDDYKITDPSGYGRLCGCDDKSIYSEERDCELWFNIYQNELDGDTLPYWTETYAYHTDPEINNIGDDFDEDGCAIEWEHKWGYNPFIWENHKNLDYDKDSINNYEEFLTAEFLSDPFRKDIFLEMDYMDYSPDGVKSIVPEEAKEILKKPYHQRNIIFHVDDYLQGGQIVPFDNLTEQDEILQIYNDYFLNNQSDNWRRGVFHYSIFVYLCKPNGFAFSGDGGIFWGYGPGTNSFIVCSTTMERIANRTKKSVEYIYAASIIHEMGHNFGIRFGHPLGCDNRRSTKPWCLSFWLFNNYKSIMNYRYTYYILDYSDGTHGTRDFNDWAEIDLSYFEPRSGIFKSQTSQEISKIYYENILKNL